MKNLQDRETEIDFVYFMIILIWNKIRICVQIEKSLHKIVYGWETNFWNKLVKIWMEFWKVIHYWPEKETKNIEPIHGWQNNRVIENRNHNYFKITKENNTHILFSSRGIKYII